MSYPLQPDNFSARQPEYRNFLDPAAKEELQERGWVILKDVPPNREGIEALLSPIGELMPQYGQKKFWMVEVKDPDISSSLGGQQLDLHTELAEFASPPEYVSLYAERPASKGGALRLLDVRRLLSQLPEAHLTDLLSQDLTVRAEGPIAERYGEFAYTAPLLCASINGLSLRFDQDFIDQNSPKAIRDFQQAIKDYAPENFIEVMQAKGTLIVWDNRFMLHGRSEFSDPARKLWRCCIRKFDQSAKN